eukprot:2006043-Prymnesium_polylepis.1
MLGSPTVPKEEMWHLSAGSSEDAAAASSLPSISVAVLRTPASESLSLATTAAACCASTACSSLPSASTAALRTRPYELNHGCGGLEP